MKKHMKDTRKLALRKEAIQALGGIDLGQVAAGVQRPDTFDCSNQFPNPCSTAC